MHVIDGAFVLLDFSPSQPRQLEHRTSATILKCHWRICCKIIFSLILHTHGALNWSASKEVGVLNAEQNDYMPSTAVDQ